jgi:hypothetical protein
MGRALRQWLDAHQLPAIIIAVLGAVVTLATLLVLGGFFLMAP